MQKFSLLLNITHVTPSYFLQWDFYHAFLDYPFFHLSGIIKKALFTR